LSWPQPSRDLFLLRRNWRRNRLLAAAQGCQAAQADAPTTIKRNIVMTIDIKTVAGEAINILDVFEKFAPYLSSMLATTPVAVG